MKRRVFLLGLGLFATTGALAALRQSSSSRPPRIVTTKEAAYLIGGVEPLLSGKIAIVEAAPGGRWALIVQDLRPESTPENQIPAGEQKLWLYDALRRKTTLLHRLQDDPAKPARSSFLNATWFPGTKKALVSITSNIATATSEGSISLGLVDVERPVVRWVPAPSNRLWMAVAVPGTSLLLLQGETPEKPQRTVLSIASPEGNFSPAVVVGKSNWARMTALSADVGSAIFDEVNYVRNDAAKTMTAEHQWFSLRLKDAQVTPLKEQPKDMVSVRALRKPPTLALTLQQDTSTLTGNAGRTTRTEALWIEATTPGPEKKFTRALVAAESDASRILLSDLSAVLFTHDGALYAAPIATLDRLAFEKLQKQLAITNAKQTGLGLMMYAQDYDENFPHDPSSVKNVLLPYLKDRDILENFTYTYSGNTSLSKLDKPDQTQLGYITAPGGRAVVFADGHVRWEAG